MEHSDETQNRQNIGRQIKKRKLEYLEHIIFRLLKSALPGKIYDERVSRMGKTKWLKNLRTWLSKITTELFIQAFGTNRHLENKIKLIMFYVSNAWCLENVCNNLLIYQFCTRQCNWLNPRIIDVDSFTRFVNNIFDSWAFSKSY